MVGEQGGGERTSGSSHPANVDRHFGALLIGTISRLGWGDFTMIKLAIMLFIFVLVIWAPQGSA